MRAGFGVLACLIAAFALSASFTSQAEPETRPSSSLTQEVALKSSLKSFQSPPNINAGYATMDDLEAALDIVELQSRADKVREWRNWKPDEPFDLSGEVPETDAVRAAIKTGVDYVLSQQKDNGAWDVVLNGDLLSGTADDAVDAVTATSMAGIALRSHFDYDPDRIAPALRKGADFVMDRIIRGKLSTVVLYAIWRYSFGVRFLMGEYRATNDEEYKDRLFGVCRRMVSSLLKMQNTNDPDERPRLERTSRMRVSRKGGEHRGVTGIICALPTDEDYKGGALVTKVMESSDAWEQGIRPGDRIVKVQRLRIENAYDFYAIETSFLEGASNLAFEVKKADAEPGDKPRKYSIDVPISRPGSIGAWVVQGSEGVKIQGFYPYSPLVDEKIEVGHEIVEIDREPVTSVEQFREMDLKLVAGKRVRVGYKADPSKRTKKTVSCKAGQRLDGWWGFRPNDEDKGDDNGIDILWVQRGGIADQAGLKVGDRITHVDDYAILGYDHFDSLSETFYYDQKVTFKGFRMIPDEDAIKAIEEAKAKAAEEAAKEEEEKKAAGDESGEGDSKEESAKEESAEDTKEEETKEEGAKEEGESSDSSDEEEPVIGGPGAEEAKEPEIPMKREDFEYTLTLLPYGKPGTLEISAKTQGRGRSAKIIVTEVKKKGVSDEAGLRVDDIILAIDGNPLNNTNQLSTYLQRQVWAGGTVVLKIQRSGKEMTISVILAEREGINFNEEGGWAYYKNPHAPSFVTAAVILNMEEIIETLDFGSTGKRAIKKSIRSATAALDHLKIPDPADAKKESFVYDIRGRNSKNWRDIRGNVGRVMVGMLALRSQNKVSSGELKRSLETFLEHRDELDRVRTYPHTHYQKRWNNAAYYWLFGHYYAALVSQEVSSSLKKRAQETILKALMLKREDDGTWLGHVGFGPLCGTTHALMIFGELEGDFRKPGEVREVTQHKDDKDKDTDKKETPDSKPEKGEKEQ